MSRPFYSRLKWSIPFITAAFALTGCGSGSRGTADLNGAGSGGSVTVEKPVTVTTTFDFSAPLSYFVVGTPPIHARFLGGVAANNGAWIIKKGTTGTVYFGTPADAVKFSAKDNYTTAGAGSGVNKTSASSPKKVDAP